LGFAIALALPFTLFALFPAWLKQAPKSGAWMNIIKVTLGFIELAFALKFFSVADLAYGWGLLDREVFLSLWIAIFLLLGLYLIGVYKFPSDMPNTASAPKPMPVACILLGLVSIAFSFYMIPGLWGAPCKAVSAFAPPMSTQDFNLYHQEVTARYTDYEEGMAAAAREGKPVLLDFTGFGCVNCRKMEAAVWTDPAVADRLNNDYILVSLYVDDKRPLATPVEVNDNGEKRTLRTVGDKWAYLEQYKFGHLTQPFYVPVSPQGKPLTKPYSYNEDISKFLEFLAEGLSH
jgi:thiol:disulfide interchange protein DsbD